MNPDELGMRKYLISACLILFVFVSSAQNFVVNNLDIEIFINEASRLEPLGRVIAIIWSLADIVSFLQQQELGFPRIFGIQCSWLLVPADEIDRI